MTQMCTFCEIHVYYVYVCGYYVMYGCVCALYLYMCMNVCVFHTCTVYLATYN